MATVRDIVEGAYRKLAVVADDEALNADQMAQGVTQLNDMMFGWELFGVDVSHTALADDDAFPLDDKFIEGTKWQLASRLAPDSLVGAPDSDVFFRALQAAYMTITASTIPLALRRTASQRREEF